MDDEISLSSGGEAPAGESSDVKLEHGVPSCDSFTKKLHVETIITRRASRLSESVIFYVKFALHHELKRTTGQSAME